MECNYYNSNIGYFDRLDHVSGVIQELVFILILERIINCYCSNYISLWCILLIEFYRNLNHSLNITTHAIDIGLFTFYPLFWLFKVIGVLLQFPCCRQIFVQDHLYISSINLICILITLYRNGILIRSTKKLTTVY